MSGSQALSGANTVRASGAPTTPSGASSVPPEPPTPPANPPLAVPEGSISVRSQSSGGGGGQAQSGTTSSRSRRNAPRSTAADRRRRRGSCAASRVFATNTKTGRLADLEVTRGLRARAEDRIRALKDTGATNLPLHGFDKNQLWLELAQLAAELLAWTQLLAWHDQPARVWEPKRMRLRLLAVAGRVITTGRRRILRLSQRWPWADLVLGGHRRLAAIT